MKVSLVEVIAYPVLAKSAEGVSFRRRPVALKGGTVAQESYPGEAQGVIATIISAHMAMSRLEIALVSYRRCVESTLTR